MQSIQTIQELIELLEQAIKPSFCRFSKQDDYIQTALDVKDIIDELKTIKELS